MTDKEILKIKKMINDVRIDVATKLERLQEYIDSFKDEPSYPKDDEPPF